MTIFTKPAITVAVLQTLIEQGEREKNWKRTMDLFEQALVRQPKLMVLPEAFATGVNFIILRQMAEPVPGPTTDRLSELASFHSVHIAAGVLELGEDRKVYDSAVLFAPNGALLAKYRRRFLWTGERNYVSPGDQPMVVPTALGNIGLLVGYDLCFPEACSTFLDRDVNIAICVASVFERLNFNARRLALARAMDSHCYFVYANAVGFHQFANMRYTGHSTICADPYFLQVQLQATPSESLGVVAEADAEPVCLLGCLSLEDLAAARCGKLPFKTDARFTVPGLRPQVLASAVAAKTEPSTLAGFSGVAPR